MPAVRQLAAIMFTGIAGYTALSNDGQNASDLLLKNRQLQQPLIHKFNGTWIKETGACVLASFTTVTDAISCAISIQKACEPLPHLKLHIGIHIGEMLFENGDVYGDGVNIASRVQALAPAGSIWVSEAVNNILSNKKNFPTKFVSEAQLKNAKEPVRIFEVVTSTAMQPPVLPTVFSPKQNDIAPQKSIAVLPFINMSNDPEQEYFSEGMAEEIINSLVHVQDLKVAGRMSSFQFKNTKADLREVGEKLGVQTVLEGSVRKSGNMLRIIVQLVNVKDGFQLWSEKYDRPMDDIFAIQDEIALSITEKLKVTLLQKERDSITKSHTNNTEAYDLYLKGRFYIIRRGASVLTGIQYFRKAIAIDPDFALAYAGYADANLLLATYGLASPQQLMLQAKEYAERAISLDPTLCEPYCSLAYYYTCCEWNWTKAKKNFLTSIELNPRYNEVHLRYGYNYLSWVEGNFDEAEKHGETAIKVEPLHSISYGTYSLILHAASKFDKALEICKMGIELDANSFLCRLNEANIYLALQQYTEAIASYETALTISNRHHFVVTGLIASYSAIGEVEKAGALMAELKDRATKEYITNTFLGTSAAHLNNMEEAFEYFEKAYANREPVLLSIKYEHWVPDNIRSDARFQDLLNRIGFPVKHISNDL